MHNILKTVLLVALTAAVAGAYPNRVTGELEYSLLTRDETWTGAAVSWLRFMEFGGFTLHAGGYDRPYGTEVLGGAGVFYKLTPKLVASYHGAFADPGVYIPRHRHQPGLEFTVHRDMTAGAGADLAFYEAGDLLLGTAFLEQRFSDASARISLKGGTDPAGENVAAGMLVLHYGRSDALRYRLGGAYGHETPDGVVTGNDPTVQVAAVFGGVNVPFENKGGVHARVTGEWRDGAYFRSVLAVAPYVSF